MSRKSKRRSVKTGTTTTASNIPASRSDSFNPDYTYVRQDLKRIGILAGTFISFLVILSFFIN